MIDKLLCCQFSDSNTEDAFRRLEKRKSIGVEKIVSLILAVASCSTLSLELREGSIKNAIFQFILGGAYFASFYLASLHPDHYITHRRHYARAMRLLAVSVALFQSPWSRLIAAPTQHTWLTILSASRLHAFWIEPIAYYLPLGEHILFIALLLFGFAVGNNGFCHSPLLDGKLEKISELARNIQNILGMQGLEHRYFQGQDSGIRHCISLITFTQLLLGAIASIWVGYYTEMSARSKFSLQAQQQQKQSPDPTPTPAAASIFRFTDKEKIYFSMYDACGAGISFIAALPFLAVISWAFSVILVANKTT